jgi:hypothetical protein
MADEGIKFMRGVLVALCVAVPFWVVVAWAVSRIW